VVAAAAVAARGAVSSDSSVPFIAGAGPPAQRRSGPWRAWRYGSWFQVRPAMRGVATRRFQCGVGMSAAAASVFRPLRGGSLPSAAPCSPFMEVIACLVPGAVVLLRCVGQLLCLAVCCYTVCPLARCMQPDACLVQLCMLVVVSMH
jgi:hypothetical protein